MRFLESNSFLLTQKSMDYLWKKQNVITDNIANAETPGFKGRFVTFEDELKGKLSSMEGQKNSRIRNEILGSDMKINFTQNESTRLDGNNINVDEESMELAETGIQYQYALKSFSDDIARLRTVIKGQ